MEGGSGWTRRRAGAAPREANARRGAFRSASRPHLLVYVEISLSRVFICSRTASFEIRLGACEGKQQLGRHDAWQNWRAGRGAFRSTMGHQSPRSRPRAHQQHARACPPQGRGHHPLGPLATESSNRSGVPGNITPHTPTDHGLRAVSRLPWAGQRSSSSRSTGGRGGDARFRQHQWRARIEWPASLVQGNWLRPRCYDARKHFRNRSVAATRRARLVRPRALLTSRRAEASRAAMVVIHVKRTEADQFLVETTVTESNDALIRRLVSVGPSSACGGSSSRPGPRALHRNLAPSFDPRGQKAARS